MLINLIFTMLYKFPQHYRLSLTYSVTPALASWTATAYCSISVLILSPGRDCVKHFLAVGSPVTSLNPADTLNSDATLLLEDFHKVLNDKIFFMRKIMSTQLYLCIRGIFSMVYNMFCQCSKITDNNFLPLWYFDYF